MPRGSSSEPSTSADEIELKFAVAPEALRRLRRHPLFASVPASRRGVTSTYFDTPDLDLRRRGLALRLRKEGRHHIQTLKPCGAMSTADPRRREWRSPVAGAAPDLSRVGADDQLAGIDGAMLQPVFISRIRRTTWLLRLDGDARIEVACDQGAIETPDGRSLPVSELELELKEGSVRTLFATARALNEREPLHIETRSKAERGYGLIAGDPDVPSWTAPRLGKIDLRRDMPVEDALSAIARHCLRHMLANDEAALENTAEGVHQMRVALRRLRATFSLFRPLIPAAQWRWVSGETKRIASALGEARNWDVLAHHLAPLERAFPGDADVAALMRAACAKREAAYGVMRETVASSDYTDFALGMMGWIETRGWRERTGAAAAALLRAPLGDMADELLERRHRKARKLAKRFTELDPAGRHKLRIALKKLRYAIDAMQRIYAAKPAKRHLKRLSRLQDDLGLLNDVATTDRLLRELVDAPASTGDPRRGAALVQGWYRCILAKREAKLGKRLSRFLKVKPFWHPGGED